MLSRFGCLLSRFPGKALCPFKAKSPACLNASKSHIYKAFAFFEAIICFKHIPVFEPHY